MPAQVVSLRRATAVWWSVGWQTFGGPAAQIAIMQRTFVDEQRWIGQRRFLHALSYCMLLPGPEAQQLATYLGWLLHGTRGAVVAGSLFVLPGAVVMLVLSGLYVSAADTDVVEWVLSGLAAAVLAVVVQAVVRVGRRALHHSSLVALAVCSFAALALLGVPFPVVVVAAALVGLVLARLVPAVGAQTGPEVGDGGPAPLLDEASLHTQRGSVGRSGRLTAVALALWAAPVGTAALLLGPDSTVVRQTLFFSFVALITVGGAYAVLTYVSEEAVDAGWVSPLDMVRGLALAETTPGPLIMVVQFVAFVGAFRAPGDLDPWVAAVLAAMLTTWVTFLPSFWFILVGAPYVERLRGNRRLSAALTGVTAAVVGVIATLALTFAQTTFFTDVGTWSAGPLSLPTPDWSTLRWAAVAVAAVAAVLVLRLGWSVLRVLGVAAVLGLALGLAGAW